jgi:hypothetical protein
MSDLSPEEIRLNVLDHFAEFIGKLVGEEDRDACLDFASTMLEAVTLDTTSIDENGVITATMKLVPIDDLLADFLDESK